MEDPEAGPIIREIFRITRVKEMYQWGHIELDEYMSTIGELNETKQRLRQAASQSRADDDPAWREKQILDLLQVRDQADVYHRSRLVAGIFECLEVDTDPDGSLSVLAVPRPAWKGFFGRVVSSREAIRVGSKRETRVSRALPTQPHRVRFCYDRQVT